MNLNFSPSRADVNKVPRNDRLSSFMKPLFDVSGSPQRSKGLEKAKLMIKGKYKGNVEKAFDKVRSTKAPLVSTEEDLREIENTVLIPISSKPNRDETASVRSERKVSFAMDENGNIAEDHNYAKYPLTRHDIKNIWWCRKDLRQCRQRAQDACKFYVDCRPDYRPAVTRMLVRCGAQPKDSLEGKPQAFDTNKECEAVDMRTIADGACRGLEKRLINSLHLPFHRHKRSIQSVLETQRRLNKVQENFFSSDQQCRLIASQYGINTRYATVWARKIAQEDAQNVVLVIDI